MFRLALRKLTEAQEAARAGTQSSAPVPPMWYSWEGSDL